MAVLGLSIASHTLHYKRCSVSPAPMRDKEKIYTDPCVLPLLLLQRFVVERSPAWGTVLVERNVDSLFMRERCCIGHKILRDSWLIKTKLGEVEEGNYTNRLSDQQGQAAINR